MKILVATDGSECAEVAIDLVGSIDWPVDSTINVVEAVSSGVAVFGGPWPPIAPVDTSRFDESLRALAETHLADAAARLAAPGRAVETSVASGRAADVIGAIAADVSADLIVVGSRGHGTLESMLLGSVSAEVVDRARVPVLVARRRVLGDAVFAWDGSDGAARAAAIMLDWGILAASQVHVVSVADAEPRWWIDPSMIGEEAAAEAYARAFEPSRHQHEEMAQEMAERMVAAGVHAVSECLDGDPATCIVDVAEATNAGLVVVGTHGRTGLARLLLGSVARNVLHHAPCSVLVVHAPEAQATAG